MRMLKLCIVHPQDRAQGFLTVANNAGSLGKYTYMPHKLNELLLVTRASLWRALASSTNCNMTVYGIARTTPRSLMSLGSFAGVQPAECSKHLQFLHDFCFTVLDPRRALEGHLRGVP